MQPSHELTLQQCVTMEANHKGVCLGCGIVSQETHPGVARAHCGHCGANGPAWHRASSVVGRGQDPPRQWLLSGNPAPGVGCLDAPRATWAGSGDFRFQSECEP